MHGRDKKYLSTDINYISILFLQLNNHQNDHTIHESMEENMILLWDTHEERFFGKTEDGR